VASQLHFPRWNLEIAAGYLILIGIVGIVWPLLDLGPKHKEFQAQSLAFRLGAHLRQLTLSAATAVAGVGLFLNHAWARKLALGLLLIGTIYTANAFAWGFSGGPPTLRVLWFSRIAILLWNGVWFYVIYRLAV
jgi:hypothetical protein